MDGRAVPTLRIREKIIQVPYLLYSTLEDGTFPARASVAGALLVNYQVLRTYFGRNLLE